MTSLRHCKVMVVFFCFFLGKCFANANQVDRSRVGRLIDIAYAVAKSGQPFTVYPLHAALERKHGVDVGTSYISDKYAKIFTDCVGISLKNELKQELSNAKYFSILMDGSTDCAVMEQELFYIIYINSDGTLRYKFMSIKNPEHANAEGLYSLLQEVMAEFDIDITKKFLVGFGADGASVNMGVKTGVSTRLQKGVSPWLVSVHCFNHRLELSVRDAFAQSPVDDVIDMLRQLYYLYRNSPKRLRELKDLADIMAMQVRKPKKACGTRWVQHKLEAAQSLIKSFDVIATHLAAMASDPTHDKAKMKGLHQKMTRLPFVAHLLLLETLLLPVAKLSLAWQQDSAEITELYVAEERMQQALDDMTSKISTCDEGTKLGKLLNASGEKLFKGIHLTHDTSVDTETFKRQGLLQIEKLRKHLDARFAFKSDSIFNAARLLDTKLWPDNTMQLKDYHNDTVQKVVLHFKDIIEMPCSTDDGPSAVLEEWCQFKLYMQGPIKANPRQVWKTLHQMNPQPYPILHQVANIMRVYPFSNGVVESCFSLMNKIKTDWRASLATPTLESIMRIKKEGPTVDAFNSAGAVEEFFSTERRPVSKKSKTDA